MILRSEIWDTHEASMLEIREREVQTEEEVSEFLAQASRDLWYGNDKDVYMRVFRKKDFGE